MRIAFASDHAGFDLKETLKAHAHAHGHEVVDWIADYWSRIGSFPVRSQVSPGDVRAALPPIPPEQGEPFSAVLADSTRDK